MAEHAIDVAGVEVAEWGPVCRGFTVDLATGERGRVEDIRVDAGRVQLVVATGLFARRLVTIHGIDIEAILPKARRIVVAAADEDPGAVETAGGIVRMPAVHSAPSGAQAGDAA